MIFDNNSSGSKANPNIYDLSGLKPSSRLWVCATALVLLNLPETSDTTWTGCLSYGLALHGLKLIWENRNEKYITGLCGGGI